MELNRKTIILLFLAITALFFVVLSVVFRGRSSEQPTSNIPSPQLTRVPTIPAENPDELLREQGESDKMFGDWQKNLYETYPWYDKLPLQTERYFVYFNPEKKTFTAKLYPTSSQPEQIEALKKEIRTKLTELEIPYTEDAIEWIVSSS